MRKRVHMVLSALILSLYGGGCGGGEGGGSPAVTTETPSASTSTPSTSTGYFIDAPVQGLAYSTPTQSGKTTSQGVYLYVPGEIVTFKVGDVVLGSAPGSSTPISPMHLGGAGTTRSSQKVKNIATFLQSLDPNKGAGAALVISDAVHQQLTSTITSANTGIIANLLADFKSGSNVSSFNSDLSNIVAAISAISPGLTVVPEATAMSNMVSCLAKQGISVFSGAYSDAAKSWNMIVSGDNNFVIVLPDGSIKSGVVDNVSGDLSIPNLDKSSTTPYDASVTGNIKEDGSVTITWLPTTTSTPSTTAATPVSLAGNQYSFASTSPYAGKYTGTSTSLLKDGGGSPVSGLWFMTVDGNNNVVTSYHGNSSVVNSYVGASGTVNDSGDFKIVGASGSVTGTIAADGKVTGSEFNTAGTNVFTFSGQKVSISMSPCP
ncbi:MAG: hypothetical protein HQL63_13075 [Magnetococcales bacterium]|nr:hypothetical protein [Magnetococcales bacterium]MBF0322582.1 hypothetical protein [Magnetococcales bacterium]